MVNHQLVKREDGTLGVKAPDTFDEYFTTEAPFEAIEKQGNVSIEDQTITLAAEEETYALADMGTRAPDMILECDVALDPDGCAGFAFGGSEADEAYTALCLDAAEGLIHYEGNEIELITRFGPQAITRFDFSSGGPWHVKLVCENEIVVLYINDQKALSSRITHSINGAHIGVFALNGNAQFSNISVKLP